MGGLFNPPPSGTYRLKKAVNANATTAAAGGMDGLIAFVAANNAPGSTALLALAAAPDIAGGDFEAQLLAWLQAPTSATPAGLGLSPSAAAALVAALRTAAGNLAS